MLILTRKVGEKIRIGEDITVCVTRKRRDGKLAIGIEAPKDVPVLREELVGRERPNNTTSTKGETDEPPH